MGENEMAVIVGDARRVRMRANSGVRIATGRYFMPMRVKVAIAIPEKFPSL